jgi:protein-S-isoprenylcysteine O-methyltransferase Ste14
MMFLKTIPVALLAGALLFLSAGRLEVPSFWYYVALLWGSAGTIYTLALRVHPGLVAERFRPPSDRDRSTRRIALPLAVAHYVLAGLDAGRFAWSVPAQSLQLLGLALVAAAMALVGWTLLSNPYASSAVRIQDEREHKVITHGPYAFIRHPMYLAVLLFSLGSGPALGSWWSGLALLPLVAVFVRRTLLEDRMLQAELPGYLAYAANVRWRVVPGVF